MEFSLRYVFMIIKLLFLLQKMLWLILLFLNAAAVKYLRFSCHDAWRNGAASGFLGPTSQLQTRICWFGCGLSLIEVGPKRTIFHLSCSLCLRRHVFRPFSNSARVEKTRTPNKHVPCRTNDEPMTVSGWWHSLTLHFDSRLQKQSSRLINWRKWQSRKILNRGKQAKWWVSFTRYLIYIFSSWCHFEYYVCHIVPNLNLSNMAAWWHFRCHHRGRVQGGNCPGQRPFGEAETVG